MSRFVSVVAFVVVLAGSGCATSGRVTEQASQCDVVIMEDDAPPNMDGGVLCYRYDMAGRSWADRVTVAAWCSDFGATGVVDDFTVLCIDVEY